MSYFESILALATILTGLIWLADSVLFAGKRRMKFQGTDIAAVVVAEKTKAKKSRDPLLVEYAKSFFPVLLIVLLLRSFVVEPFHIPSSSMLPTLLVGDFILVNKFDYGLRLPVIHSKIIPIGEPKRGDVIVFHYPEASARQYCQENPLCMETGGMREVYSSAGEDYIKRVIGMPGDHIVYQGGKLAINGVQIPSSALGLYYGHDALGATIYQEKFGNTTHDILSFSNQTGPEGAWVVPQGEYFVMGDNRNYSFDSRYWGFVPEKNVVGKAFFIWLNIDAFHNPALWHRMGKVIH
ncbi:MAG: signal peptidase I [Gammaproteobacteria bacterium]